MRGAVFEGLGLRTRFTLAMLAFVAAGLLVVGLSASALFRSHVERIFHAELEEHLVELVGLTDVNAAGQRGWGHAPNPVAITSTISHQSKGLYF
jgi:hypothetical protein